MTERDQPLAEAAMTNDGIMTERRGGPGSRPHRRGPSPKGLARRQQILDRALGVFDELGIEGTSMRAIADAIGVTHPTLSHYFASREELFIEVLREYDRSTFEALSLPGDSLTDLVVKGSEHSMRVPGLMGLLHSMMSRALEPDNELSRAYIIERYDTLRRQLTTILELGRAAGTVRRDIPLEETASLVLAAADGLSAQWLLDRSADLRSGLLLLERLLEPTS